MARTKIDPSLVPIMPAAQVKGTTTNDSAAAGYVGEVISSYAQSVAAPTSGQIGDVTSITLTAGDWMMCGEIYATVSGGTLTELTAAISTTSGNSSSGWISGDNAFYNWTISSTAFTVPVVPRRVSISSSTTYYLKISPLYTGTCNGNGRITAWRIR